MRSITPQDAQEFRKYLEGPTRSHGKQPLAKPTVSRRVKFAKQFFGIAKREKLIAENPFDDVVAGSQVNPDRLELIETDDVHRLIAVCDEPDWVLIFLLARFGGIRIPSELVKLKWRHVNFARDKMLIHSPKTERHVGKDKRWIPIFDEMRQPLRDAYANARSRDEFVIRNPVWRQVNANLRTELERFLEGAGIRCWPKPFVNMRSTRETELIERLGLKVASAIIGNSEIVALQHYQQLRPDYLESAVEKDRAGRREAQKEAHKTAETGEIGRNGAEGLFARPNEIASKTPEIPRDSTEGLSIPTNPMGPQGLELLQIY